MTPCHTLRMVLPDGTLTSLIDERLCQARTWHEHRRVTNPYERPNVEKYSVDPDLYPEGVHQAIEELLRKDVWTGLHGGIVILFE